MLTKDVHLIEATAKDADCPIPIMSSIAKVYDAAIEDGFGDKDVAALYGSIAAKAGLDGPKKN